MNMSSLPPTEIFPREDIITVNQALEFLGLSCVGSEDEFEQLPSEEELLQARGTHNLVAYIPCDLRYLIEKFPASFYYTKEEAWYTNHPIATASLKAGWYLVKKRPTESEYEQFILLVYTEIARDLIFGKRVLLGKMLYCTQTDGYGKPVCIIGLDQGLYITWDPRIQIAK
jgi:hypothetical protein